MARGFARGMAIGLAKWDLPPGPLPTRKGEWREGLREIYARGFWGSWRDPFAQSHQNSQGNKLQKAMCSPFPCRKGGRGDRSLFHGAIHSPKAIRTAKNTNHQKAMRSPFPCRKGGRGDRSLFHGVIHSPKAIKTAKDTNHQKAMRSPFPRRHRRSLQ